jgi:agmatine deiminase
MSTSPTLREQGWRMPAEWEPHQATWMSWPSRRDTSFPGGNHHDRVLPVFARLIEAITDSEPLYLNCVDEADRAWIERNVSREAQRKLILTEIPAVYPWCRDHGALFVVNDTTGEVAATTWRYNAWGGKYPEAFPDTNIPAAMARLLGLPAFPGGMVLEGGSIDLNGCGSLLTTESCLLNPNRNPQLTRRQIEERLRDFLGVEKILWLHDGVAGDDTDGHIDDITRFNVLVLPMPRPIIMEDQRLPASYANFYITNRSVIVPVFNDPNDEQALGKLQECFPDRRIVGIDSTELVWGLGSFHCLTQQVPRGRQLSVS